MKVNDKIMGFAKYNSEEYPFLYSDGILQLMPNSNRSWQQERMNVLEAMKNLSKWEPSDDWIGYSYIEAKMSGGISIIFYVSNDSSN